MKAQENYIAYKYILWIWLAFLHLKEQLVVYLCIVIPQTGRVNVFLYYRDTWQMQETHHSPHHNNPCTGMVWPCSHFKGLKPRSSPSNPDIKWCVTRIKSSQLLSDV